MWLIIGIVLVLLWLGGFFMFHTAGFLIHILLVLAVTCYLAGIHFDRTFVWVSVFLVLAALGGTEIEAYLWLLVVLAVLAAALVVFSAVLMKRRTPAAPGSA